MAQGKMTDEEKQTLISFQKQNLILWDSADLNCRNKVKRSLIKVKLVPLFEGKILRTIFGEMLPFFKNINDSRNKKICQWK